MGQTVVEKIARQHAAVPHPTPVAAGEFLMLRPHRLLTHDNTLAVMRKFHAWGGKRLVDPGQAVVVLDHDIQNDSAEARRRYAEIAAFCRRQRIEFHPAGTGIGHQVLVESLHTLPGHLVVAADSHANMYGALGALGTPVVRSDAAAIWATGECWWEVPRTVRVTLLGRLPEGSGGKDVILALCAHHPDAVLGAAIEFAGPGVATLDVDARLTIANMTTEWGAVTGWFPVDEVTLDALASRRRLARPQIGNRVTDADLATWSTDPPAPDPDARYAGEITLDLASVAPFVTGPDSLQRTTPLAELAARRIAIDKAYLVSCVNSRASDLAAAAAVLRGRRVAPGVELYVAAASRESEETAQARGDWQALLDAGARPLPPGCGPCIGLGAGLLEPGEVGISASNRNFRGRMGSPDSHCYLASPTVVAASAVAGFIGGPVTFPSVELTTAFVPGAEPAAVAGGFQREPGFPRSLRGRLVFLPADHLDTDGIYAKEHLYRDLDPAAMARVVFENHDPGLAARLRPGDVLVGGRDFGTGSSREQAVTALIAAGVRAVVAASFSATYLRNAFNNGFPGLVCPALVDYLGEDFADRIAVGARSVSHEDVLDVDFPSGTLRYRDRAFRFVPPGPLRQGLVAEGGIGNRVRRLLGSPTRER